MNTQNDDTDEGQDARGAALRAAFEELLETEMLRYGLNPDDPRDELIYLRAKLMELRSREH
jgi:hypothetical protein